MKLSELLLKMLVGQTYICHTSISDYFTPGNFYKIHGDKDGCPYIIDDEGTLIYDDEELDAEDLLAEFCDAKAFNSKTKSPWSGPTTQPINKTAPIVEHQPLKEIPMLQSQINETVNYLNGLKPGQEKLVKLRQAVSTSKSISIDLATLIKTSDAVKELKAGEKCVVKGLDVNAEKITLHLSMGDVEKEENVAVQVALSELVK